MHAQDRVKICTNKNVTRRLISKEVCLISIPNGNKRLSIDICVQKHRPVGIS